MPTITHETFNGSVRQCFAFELGIDASNAPNQIMLCKSHWPAMYPAMAPCAEDSAHTIAAQLITIPSVPAEAAATVLVM